MPNAFSLLMKLLRDAGQREFRCKVISELQTPQETVLSHHAVVLGTFSCQIHTYKTTYYCSPIPTKRFSMFRLMNGLETDWQLTQALEDRHAGHTLMLSLWLRAALLISNSLSEFGNVRKLSSWLLRLLKRHGLLALDPLKSNRLIC